MGGRAGLCLLVSLLLGWDLARGAVFFLTTPSELHYDADYTVTVTATGVNKTDYITLKFLHNMVQGSLNATVMKFTSDGSQTWTVRFSWQEMSRMEDNKVTLDMQSMTSPITQHTVLSFSRRSGYIFIQTDKPLYTPRQTVKFRILAVDENQKLANHTLKVDIMNDKQIVVDRMRYRGIEAFKPQEFQLPREANPGMWSISAVYEGSKTTYGASQKVQFEVKEYVLPQFYSTLSISEDVITKSTQWLTITIDSKYVHGRPVLGQVEIRLGVWEPGQGVSYINYHVIAELEKGKMRKDIRISRLLPRGRDFYRTRRLYVSANITESGTLENDTIIDTSTFISHPYYELNYNKSKTTFKPGFPYLYKMQSRAKSGRPSSWIEAYVTSYSVHWEAGKKKSIFLASKQTKLDGNGELQWMIEAPENSQQLIFKALILDLTQDFAVFKYEVPKAYSYNNQYIHISMEREVEKRRSGIVLLRYSAPDGQVGRKITVMVLAKGQVLYSTETIRNTDMRSTVEIPRSIYLDLTPQMRVVAFYHVNGETVIDSLTVDTKDICVAELALHPGGGLLGRDAIIEPKDSYTIEVHGEGFMTVGMVAVDTAVYLLNDKKTLTRESMFQQLGSHDHGNENGDGDSVTNILKNSGLIQLTLNTTSMESDYPGVRRLKAEINSAGGENPSFLYDFVFHESDGVVLADAPPQSVRKYFPESWLFDNFVLPKSGVLHLNTKMPDSLTTWSFMAVGISATRGVCVSRPHEETVEKLFFVDVRLPYKVTRLEVVKVRIAIYNFREDLVELYGKVSGDGVCFPTERFSDWNDNGTDFTMSIDRRSTKGLEVKMIPLRNGELTIRVDVIVKNDPTRDVVEKRLYVEAEGMRVRKSITFVLDPEAKHAKTRRVKNNKIVLSNTTTVSNMININTKLQETKIDLALPSEVIRGTERCRMTAFGDLMGDIINHAVIQSRSLMDQPVVDAEEVLGDLGPTLHALLYTREHGLLDAELKKKGQRFIKHAVARLLSYKNGDAYSLTPNSKKATWLTSFVLKTLCHAEDLAFIDKYTIIDKGIRWLYEQVESNGTLNEQDWRLANDSFDYRVMLSADALITLELCGSKLDDKMDHWFELEGYLYYHLEESVDKITHPMVLAKAAYALDLIDGDTEAIEITINRLLATKKTNHLGHTFWSAEKEEDDEEGEKAEAVPFWYHQGAKASSIEGTAFALMLFLNRRTTNVDSIADWLVAQRNENGAFVGAMDSTAAIHALAQFSKQKHGNVNLQCNITSVHIKEYKHSFKFTKKNAMDVESVNNVPMSQVLQVMTSGQGLGQMQVNVEYNIPLDKNQYCPYRVQVELKQTSETLGLQGTLHNLNKGPLCLSCGFGCPEEEEEPAVGRSTSRNTYTIEETNKAKLRATKRKLRQRKGKKRKGSKKNKKNRKSKKNRNARSITDTTESIRHHPAASKKVVCFHICLQHLDEAPSGPTTVDIEMLSGYNPVETDYSRIKDIPDVQAVEYSPNSGVLSIHFLKVDNQNETCIGFRARDDLEVGRPSPATVLVKQQGVPGPVCALEYKPPQETASLQVYCASIGDNNRGECHCYSGLCGMCRPYRSERNIIGIPELREFTCPAKIGYHVEMVQWKDENQWFEIKAKVKSVNKTAGTDPVKPGDTITLQTPSSCDCPVWEYRNLTGPDASFFLFSSDVERLIDHKGNVQWRYLLDHRSRILRVSEPGEFSSDSESKLPNIKHGFLKAALDPCHEPDCRC